jgi:hypothetical protein
MVKIEFYAEGRHLGAYLCPAGSSQEQRNRVAKNHGIDFYDKFILDDGRVTGFVRDGQLIDWTPGVEFLTHRYNTKKTKTMDESNANQGVPGSYDPPVTNNPRTPNECYPTPTRNKARLIQISEQDYGYIVNVGCQTLVFENMDTLISKLTAYLKDPNAVEESWMSKRII